MNAHARIAAQVAHVSPVAFDECDWIKTFRRAGYKINVSEGVIFLDLGDNPSHVPPEASKAALGWVRATPDWKMRVITALSDEKPFTAAEYLAIERMVGHEVSYFHDDGKLWINVCFLGRRRGSKKRQDAHIAGLRRFRAWERSTPDWKEQIVAELDRERAAS